MTAPRSDGRWRLAANTSDSPVLIDDDGHTLGGGEYDAVDTQTQAVNSGIARGVLVYPDPPAKSATGPAATAQRRVEALNRKEEN